jgi:hypothetical protein
MKKLEEEPGDGEWEDILQRRKDDENRMFVE